MSSVIRKTAGAANVVFGVSGITVTGTIVQNYSNKTSGDNAIVLNVDGETIAKSFFNQNNQVQVDCVFNNSGALTFAIGDAITINSIACHIDDWEHLGDAKDFQKVRITATRYVNALS